MVYELENRLVVGVASSALFALGKSDDVFKKDGEEAYRAYQEAHIDDPFAPGVAFPFIQRLLSLNDLGDSEQPLVEVIVLSHNSPDTGLRVMRSVAHHELAISRAAFTQGQSPYDYIPAFNMSLFLSANDEDVQNAVRRGFPAGRVLPSEYTEDATNELRVAFDFDGVLAGDESEKVMQQGGLAPFFEHELAHQVTPHSPGPLRDFARNLNRIQEIEESRVEADSTYRRRVRVSVVTARNAPAHERAVLSLKEWGVRVNDAFFLGGVEKGRIISVLRPHIFFDDQPGHLSTTAPIVPSVHVPFGVTNKGN
jgi:5'-nucleotidase